MNILAISGSLRQSSSNTSLLKAVVEIAPENINVIIYDGIGYLPHFNPDLEEQEPPAVSAFRASLRDSQAVLISTPEYAHGVPGVLKNALDWLVSGGDLVDKPVALLNASPRSTFAQASLTETLAVMMAVISAETSVSISLPGNKRSVGEMAADPAISQTLSDVLAALARAVDTHPSNGSPS